MLKIAICDDERNICNQIEKIMLEYQNRIPIEINIEIFYSGETLIQAMHSNCDYDLIFLDIELKTITGIEVGNKIRNELGNYISKIVFVSGKSGYDRQLFAVQPFHFIEKPICKDKFFSVVDFAIKVLDKESTYFKYHVNHETRRSQMKDIVYFESQGKKVKLVTSKGEDIFYGSLYKIKKELPHTFIAPYNAYLININHAIKVTSDEIHMVNGEVIPISQRNVKIVRRLLIELEKEKINATI